MTFKSDWEKTQLRHTLPDSLIKQCLRVFYTEDEIKHFHIIEGGCANINIKVTFKHIDTPILLRIYLRDSSSAYKEQYISRLLENTIPMAEIYHIATVDGYTFAITEFLPGTPLREVLLRQSINEIKPVMFKIGNILSTISKTRITDSDLFQENTDMPDRMTPKKLIDNSLKSLSTSNVRDVLSLDRIDQISRILNTHTTCLPQKNETQLVHADFDPANILVTELNGEIKITGILDWEFAFSGPSLLDVANMLRYAHHMPSVYQDSFIEGLTSGGYTLPNHWQTTVHLLNIISLIDCLERSDPKDSPHRIRDIKALLQHLCAHI